MLVYNISHTEEGEQYPTVAEQDVVGLVGWMEGIGPYLAVGDRVTIEVVEMTEEEYASLPEFTGY